MTTPHFERSRAIFERAQRVIPKGIYGHYGHAVNRRAPAFFDRAEGARFWDVDGNEYVDLVCAYGPMILGYGHAAVEEAARAQVLRGNTVSLASPVLVDLAEELCATVDVADWALFGKNGGDATQLAVMIARAATGRRKVVTVRGGYHGVAPWMQAPGSPGTVAGDHDHVLRVSWNRPEELEDLIAAHAGDIACFLSSPYHHPILADSVLPAPGYWSRVRELCTRAGIVLAVDDVRAGFRLHRGGSHAAFGFEPDLVCFGKAIANGHPISALVGRDSLRQAAGDVFYTGTQFFNAAPMAAALATLRELSACDAVARMDRAGRRLGAGLTEVAAAHGHRLVVSGPPAMPYLRIEPQAEGDGTHAAWIGECVRRGAYLLAYHNHFLSAAHEDADVDRAVAIADEAFRAIAAG